MSTVGIKADLIERINNMDERFLKAMHFIALAYETRDENTIVSYDVDGTPRTANELTNTLDAEVEAAKRGEYITIEDFKRQSALWGQTTK